ncbi:MAG: UDP-N-acetylmuramoyl-L-alanyl-D-glutamate--2,6-diaminopimelate ligase [Anaerolinea sp.]|nr:UDP-N-acetylmuramoyl-L-alanyl-D-glutamate--2,6-diaminopimelate ligase [Anaerolinea sp.]
MDERRTVASLLAELAGAELVRGDRDTVVDSIAHDSRRSGAGALFVAVPGFSVDAHQYLPGVVAAGAAAVLVQRDRAAAWREIAGPAVIAVDDTRIALAAASAWFHHHPGREMVVVGITGTDGKTTTSHLLTSVLEASGARVGRLGTVDTYMPGESGHVTDRMTTPEAPEVQALLRRMADAGCEFAIVESTSHGLALHRLDHVEYDIAAFTNITGDHLDFHKTFEAYREAKGMLFAALQSSFDKGVRKVAVANAGDPSANWMLSRAPQAEQLRFGLEARDADVTARNILLRPDGTAFRLVTARGMADVEMRLPAMFNVMNALAAAGIGLGAGLDARTIARGLSQAPGVPGRMEQIDCGQPFAVIVDYAHTGDAVRKVLEVLRDVTTTNLIIVVGAAGERDPGRRFGVARAAAEGADFAVFTNEDPRSEDPRAIVQEIGRHAEGAGKVRGRDFIEVEDRREAIAEALGRAKAGDIVVVAGKGHEKSILYGQESRPWDDRAVTREELARLGYRES